MNEYRRIVMNTKYNDTELENLWKFLEDIPMNENEQLEEDWFIFPKGTDKEEIWHWFDEQYSKGVFKRT